MDHAHRGDAALKESKNEEAVEHFTAAITASPQAATYYIKRSQAYQRTNKIAEALEDANIAAVLAVKRQKRELIGQAQLRRGIALYRLEQYANAQKALEWAKKYDDKDRTLGIWEAKCTTQLDKLEDGDEKKQVSIQEIPDVEAPSEATASKPAAASSSNGTAATQTVSTPQQTPPSKIRHDWYQNNDSVFFSLMAKGVPKDKTTVDIQPQSLSISFPTVADTTYDFTLEPLFAPVDVAASSFKVLSTKLEVQLKKTTPGQKWPSLEGSALESAAGQPAAASTSTLPARPAAATAGPAYPTSSKSGPKNWDKIADSFVRPAASSSSKKDADSGSKPDKKKKDPEDIYLDDEDDEGDPANAFFKKLYSGADPDTRRAMMKSYQESGGTALSTNWAEVGKKRTEITPPDGMEAKKWEY